MKTTVLPDYFLRFEWPVMDGFQFMEEYINAGKNQSLGRK